MGWSHFHHEADIGLRGSGVDKESAFEAIALALTAAITNPERVTVSQTIEISCRASSDEILLVDWLNTLIYEMAVRRMLFREFDVCIANGELTAKVGGESINRDKHRPAVEVKGATYTALAVDESEAGWTVQCVVDV